MSPNEEAPQVYVLDVLVAFCALIVIPPFIIVTLGFVLSIAITRVLSILS